MLYTFTLHEFPAMCYLMGDYGPPGGYRTWSSRHGQIYVRDGCRLET